MREWGCVWSVTAAAGMAAIVAFLHHPADFQCRRGGCTWERSCGPSEAAALWHGERTRTASDTALLVAGLAFVLPVLHDWPFAFMWATFFEKFLLKYYSSHAIPRQLNEPKLFPSGK